MELFEMSVIVPIVEGEGEVDALPVLLRRLAPLDNFVDVKRPIKMRKNRFLQFGDEFDRHVSLANLKSGDSGSILILIDADDDCPASLAREVIQQARRLIPQHRRIACVFAVREFEAWFIASADSLGGRNGLQTALTPPADPEAIRGAKEWLRDRMDRPYRETSDQASFAAQFDCGLARLRSSSFDKLCREYERLIEV